MRKLFTLSKRIGEGEEVGLSHTQLELSNPRRPDLQAVQVDAMADTGAVHLCIPQTVCEQLALEVSEQRPVVLADGSRRSVPYAGPVELRLEGRRAFTGALVMGDQPLLGVIPMEDMDLVVVPKTGQVIPNPANPGAGGSIARSPRPG